MTISTGNDVYYDPYDIVLNADPYPMFGRLREEAPLYYNAQHDFYALSRFADVDKVAFVTGATRGQGRSRPVDVGNAILFLTSDESRYITGVSLPVDAGSSLK